jgi:hypothetical protein
MALSGKKYSYDVFLELGTLNLGVKFPCQVGTIWESYMKTMQAKGKPNLINGRSILNESMMCNFIVEFDANRSIFLPKSVCLILFSPILRFFCILKKELEKLAN